VDLYRVFCAGLQARGRPVGNLLFLGPTGTGKTRIVEVAAEVLFGDPRAVIKVHIFDLVKNVLVKEINAHAVANATMIYTLAFTPDGKQVVSGSYDQSLK